MQTQLLIIGAGTAGVRTAVTAANNGVDVVLVGDGLVAGTCLNTGCIPTKTLLHAADVHRTIQRSSEIGISATSELDFAKVMARMDSIRTEGRRHAEQTLEKTDHLIYLSGRAKFVGERTVEVNQTRVTGEKVIVATGTSPFIPPIPGLKDTEYLTNVEALELKQLPKSLIIIGGGYIACEFATFFATIGVNVTIIERGPSLLGVLDEDMRAPVREHLESLGVRVFTNTATTAVSQGSNRFTCSLSGADKTRVSAQQLLVACGRGPNTQGLGLQNTGVETDKRGYIEVDSLLRSSNKDVYAIGDVNGKALFAHAAKRESWYALEHALFDKRSRLDHSLVPWAVFTYPVVAGVGKSEQELKKAGEDYEVLEASLSSSGKARIIQEPEGKLKVLHRDDRILGAFMVGAQADNIIHEFVALIHVDDGLRVLHEMVHIHPTLSEVVEGLRARRQ